MQNRKIFTLCISVFLITEIMCLPVDSETRGGLRVKRFTCDVLSFEIGGISVGDQACNFHCSLQNRGNGKCNTNRICVCG
uniref:Defensin 2A n=1 Tax=Octodonta nipae TaxID=1432747 RepID=A0A5S9BFT6_9CUCU|nr:defensin 2A [Octodonta nipae]